jgi:hypothetical protein
MNSKFNPRSFSHLASAGLLALLAACGGGGGGGDAGGNTNGDPVTPSALEDNNAVATTLAVEAQASISAARRVPDGKAASQLASFANGVAAGTVTISNGRLTLACALGGSVSADFPSNPSAIAVGTAYSISFNNCTQVAGQVTNGTLSLTFSSLNNANNFSESATYNITVTQAGVSTAFTGSQACTVVAGVATCTYSDGARTFGGNFSQSGGALNGGYTWAFGTVANVNFEFSAWTASAGSVTVTGPNKFRAVVVRDGANSYTVTINGGVPRKVVLPG